MELTIDYVRIPFELSYAEREDFLETWGYKKDVMPTLIQICSKPNSNYESGLNRDYVIKRFKKDDVLIFLRNDGKIIGCCFVDIKGYSNVFKDVKDTDGNVRYSRPIDERYIAVINLFCVTQKKGKFFMNEIEKIIKEISPIKKISIFLTPKTTDLESYYRKYYYKNKCNPPEGRLGIEMDETFVKHLGHKRLRLAPRSSPY